MISEKMLDRAMEILIDRENQAAKARAAAEHMGDLTKVVLAKLMNDAPPDLKSATARETWALAHPKYTEHLEQKKAVAELDFIARDKRAAASAIVEAWRTECSNARAGAKIG